MTSWMCLCCQLAQECFWSLLLQCLKLFSSFTCLMFLLTDHQIFFDLFCRVFLQQISKQVEFYLSCPMNQIWSLNKKKSIMWKAQETQSYGIHTAVIGALQPGGGEELCWGAPAICSPSQASNKSPSNASRTASQAARPSPERGRGAETEGRLMCVQASVCVGFFC